MNNVFKGIAYTIIAVTFFACGNTPKEINKEDSAEIERKKEAREDSLKFAEAVALQGKFANVVTAVAETKPVASKAGADAADDPAIWIDPDDAANSLIIGTNKKAGLYVYNLKGEELQFVASGKMNNADLTYGFDHNGKKIDIVGASNRSTQTVDIFQIDAETKRLVDEPLVKLKSTVDDVYGFCMYKNEETNAHFAFVNGKNGKIEQWALSSTDGKVSGKLVRSFWVNSQPEGMVVDCKTNTLYLGVEEEGIFKVSALAKGDTTEVMIAESGKDNSNITFDLEGLAIYRKSAEEAYLIASVQGSFSYAIFDLASDNKYITNFAIKDGKFDGAEETDGLDVNNTPMGEAFPDGILVVQDGFNKDGSEDMNQNFKVVSFTDVLAFIK